METEVPEEKLSAFQRECITLFVRAAQLLSIPRSIGEIYGLLFSSAEPLSMEEVIEQLGISKGSASQGLRWLREVGAARTIYRAGDRRDRFVAETELRKLALGFLRESVEPHLHRGVEYLDHIHAAAGEQPAGEARDFAKDRAAKLKRWHKFGTQILPAFLRITEKF
jgi:DNA-binding transcriptional regulator GbsR (MarR family)